MINRIRKVPVNQQILVTSSANIRRREDDIPLAVRIYAVHACGVAARSLFPLRSLGRKLEKGSEKIEF